MTKRKYTVRPVNKIFILWLLAALVLFAGIACSFSYAVQKKNIMMQCENVMKDVFDLYYDKVYSFSDIYVPVFRSDEKESVLRLYFDREGDEILSARERADLVSLLREMIQQDKDIVFLALYNPDAAHNYCMTYNGNTLQELWPDMPINSTEGTSRMQLLGRYAWQDEDNILKDAFLIRGGTLTGEKSGCILVGYDGDVFGHVISENRIESPAAFLLTNESGVIYDSEGIRYTKNFNTDWLLEESAYNRAPEGRRWFTGVLRNSGREFSAAYLLPWWQVAIISNRTTPLLLLVLVCFAFFAFVLYLYSTRQIFQKVEWIQKGLTIIGTNKLDYRLRLTGMNDEFDQIANNINVMTERLKDSVEKEYQMRMRQKWSELNQIQARFNPHFLYNTLEVVRGSLFQSGNIENADYIEKLSRIFRNLTDAAPVISIREEISFCSLYMALLQLRYHDAVDIAYDIDPKLQDCGILAHLIQPAIENYFMHAMSEETEYHIMEIACEQAAEDKIRFIIADNGTGLFPERIDELNQQLRCPAMDDKGYGLTSIAKRIRLFYGEDYGIILEKNQPCGIRVIITIPKMSKEDHMEKIGIFEPHS